MKRKDNMPELVYWGLWGINSRSAALGFAWVAVALAAACFIYGFVHPLAFLGMLFLGAAAWYWHSIKWVDKNSTWKNE